jgi:phenylalanyl-tRNA synthetase beta chain
MKILTKWLRAYLPGLPVGDAQLAEDLTLRGIAVEGIYPLGEGNGSLYEMDITTNRVDAMNHYGVAREAAAIYGLSLPALAFPLPAAQSAKVPFSVRVEAEDACGRFTARVLRNVVIGNSRDWFHGAEVATYFGLLEQKMISNAVDATNFAWLAMGQPTHAFDLDKIEGGIIVRRAKKGERLKTLDGLDRVLDPEDLVVADHKKPLALAGVMGGWDTMITLETKNVLVEAAWFDPMAVRRTARRHGLHTDASHRFERGTDFNAAPVASAIVCSILLANGGTIEGELVDVRVAASEARTAQRRPVELALSEVQRILGTTVSEDGITAATVENVLVALGCGLTAAAATGKESWQVTLPSWRLDLKREIDLIEEVARVYGYNRFANTLPAFGEGVNALPWAEAEAAVRRTMMSAGFHEAIGSSFCSAAEAALTAPQPGLMVPLGNPLSEESGVLRPSLVPGMLAMVAGNLNRDVDNVRLFELGTVFSGTTEKVEERPSLAFGVAGTVPQQTAMHPARAIDFYDVKGVVEQVIARFQARSSYFDQLSADAGLSPDWLHPYRCARVAIEGITVGWFGQLHPREATSRKLKDQVFVGELYLDRLYKMPTRKPAVHEISKFQAVRRDFSLILDQSIPWKRVDDALIGLRIPELVDWRVREIFNDSRRGANEYSLLLGTTFQAPDRTLREEELQSFQVQVVDAVGKVGAHLRS